METPPPPPSTTTILAYYNGKTVDMAYVSNPASRFRMACRRVADNAASGYVIHRDSVYAITRGTRIARHVTDPAERDRVLSEINTIKPSRI